MSSKIDPESTYDRVAYPAISHPQSHPDRLATMARIAGYSPAPIANCLFLELGCGDALGLIAFAYARPASHCTGIDRSEPAIARGQRLIDQLGLKNVRLLCGDLDAVDLPTTGFDYIAAHGFYSWVPASARETAFALCGRHLTANGLAYFSYDVLPGAFLKQMTRELMLKLFALTPPRDLADAAAARAMIDAIASATPNDAWRATMLQQVERMKANTDALLLHDDLGPDHAAVWFDDFAAHVGRHHLKFVSEADPVDAFLPRLSAEAIALIDELAGGGDAIARERAADIVRGRSFRQSILCRAGATPNVPAMSAEAMAAIYVAGKLRAQPATTHAGATVFYGAADGAVTLIEPSTIAALEIISDAWPSSVRLADVMEQAAARARVANDERHKQLVVELVKGVAGVRLVELYSTPPAGAASLQAVGEKPCASALARLQSRTQEHATTLSAHRADIRGDLARAFLRLLDGTRTYAEITEQTSALAGKRVTREEIASKIQMLTEMRLLHEAASV